MGPNIFSFIYLLAMCDAALRPAVRCWFNTIINSTGVFILL